MRGVVFDLDGTLVHSEHDYAALKRDLGLPPTLPVLEGIASFGAAEQLRLFDRVDRWEQHLAQRATALPGAATLLRDLAQRDTAVGILTRNTRSTALATLRATGLDRFFAPELVLGRDEATPKPAPDGILHLLRRWDLAPAAVAMVGDADFDLLAATAAGVTPIGYDPLRLGRLEGLAALVVGHLDELVPFFRGAVSH